VWWLVTKEKFSSHPLKILFHFEKVWKTKNIRYVLPEIFLACRGGEKDTWWVWWEFFDTKEGEVGLLWNWDAISLWKFLFPSPHFFLTPQNYSFIPNLWKQNFGKYEPNFRKFGKYLPKFCNIETCISTVYFKKNSEIMFFRFYFLKKT
jgi:hypothetical protein